MWKCKSLRTAAAAIFSAFIYTNYLFNVTGDRSLMEDFLKGLDQLGNTYYYCPLLGQ
jgi:hypothetical protein